MRRVIFTISTVGMLLGPAALGLGPTMAEERTFSLGTCPRPAAVPFKAEGPAFSFDAGTFRGTLHEGGRSLGLYPVVEKASKTPIAGPYGLFSPYRMLTADARFGTAAWDWASQARLLPNGGVESRWTADKDHPMDMTAVYYWSAADTLDFQVSVKPQKDLRGFELFLASYFDGFPQSFARVTKNPDANGKPGFMEAKASAGVWQTFPRDADAVRLYQDGRWTRPPHPVEWRMMPNYAAPIALRRDAKRGLTAVLMARPSDCFAISTPFGEEGHRSVYLSLFGRDIKAGHSETARARLVIGRNISDDAAVRLYERFVAESPEAVMARVRLGLPGKSDEEIVKLLRSYVPADSSLGGSGMDWFAARLRLAQEQRKAVDAIHDCGGYVSYDYQRDAKDATSGGYVAYDYHRDVPRKPSGDAQPPGPRSLRALLGDDFFANVVGVSFVTDESSGDIELTDADLLRLKSHFAALPQLRELIFHGLSNREVRLEGIVEAVGQLERLEIAYSRVTDAGLQCLRGLKQLKTLGLPHCRSSAFTGAGLQHLKGLKSLNLCDTGVTDAGLACVAELAGLEELDVSWNESLDDNALRRLEGLRELRVLRLDATGVTDVGLQHLQELTRLKRLGLTNTHVAGNGLKHLAGLTHLQRLELYGPHCQVTDADLQYLEKMEELRALNLQGKITGVGLDHLNRLGRLDILALDHNPITDAALDHFRGLVHVKILCVRQTTLTDQGVRKLRQMLPNCQVEQNDREYVPPAAAPKSV